jgi:hypothetical protein
LRDSAAEVVFISQLNSGLGGFITYLYRKEGVSRDL